jgi:hypothetical protein
VPPSAALSGRSAFLLRAIPPIDVLDAAEIIDAIAEQE